MIGFKKYSSIENSFNKVFMEKISMEIPNNTVYVVQEKVHGCNTSFLTDGKDVKFAKRTSMLGDDENFHEFGEILTKYHDNVISLFKDLKERYPNMVNMSLFGELFGGKYPHKDVMPNNNVSVIQKGVYYTPDHEFYAFDIYMLFDNGEGCYLTVDEANELFEKHGFFYARTLFRGTLGECLNHSNEFQSHISEWLGLPSIEDNICEGIVIRPVKPLYFRNGSRVLIKSKNARFAEKKAVKKNPTQVVQKEYGEELQSLINEALSYVNENRLNNVISHIGEVSMPHDFGKVLGTLSSDAIGDFIKEHEKEYYSLEKSEQKIVNKEINKDCSRLIKEILFV